MERSGDIPLGLHFSKQGMGLVLHAFLAIAVEDGVVGDGVGGAANTFHGGE